MRANEDLEDFEDKDLIDELEWRGYSIDTKTLDELADIDLIDELENRGYNIPIDQAYLLNKVYWQIREGANVSDEMRKLIAGLTGRIL